MHSSAFGFSPGPKAYMLNASFSLDLKTRIAATVLLLFIACIWLLTYLTTARLRDEFTEVLANQQLSSVSHTAMEIEQKIKLRFDALATIAQEITPAMLADPRQLHALLRNRPLLGALFGNGVLVVAKDGLILADEPPLRERKGVSFGDPEYFGRIIATAAPTLGQARIGRFSKRPGVSFGVPIAGDDGRPIAALLGQANLGDPSLFGQISGSNVGKTGWIAVSDARYRVIVAISDPQRVLQPFPKLGVNKMLDRYASGEEGSGISINSQGKEVLNSAKQIGTTGWFVQAVLPTEEAFAPIHDMQSRAYALATALSVLASLVVWMVIRHLLRPLATASADIRGMAAGNLQLHELPVTQQDEVGELLTSFNTLFRQRQALQDRLEHLARTDSLTDLPNRRHFMEAAAQELARAARFGGTLTVLMLDLDHFKRVNDTYGHKTGDAVLQRLAEVCRAALREIDLPARLGGEEFAVLLPNTDHAAALDVAERLRQAVAAMEIPTERSPAPQITVSIGVAELDPSMPGIDALLNRADRALYRAKREGRNRVSDVG
jgi:diguanylate cyclase (GGDEF)-like protein